MKLVGIYIGVILIWTTTPLAVQWSVDSLPFIVAVGLRVALAFFVCYAALRIQGGSMVHSRNDWVVFVAGSFGYFPTMLTVYWGAQYMSSGMVAVIFGLYPFAVGIFTWLLMRINMFTLGRVIALVMAVVGLAIICVYSVGGQTFSLKGVLGVGVGVLLFGLNACWLKKVGGKMSILRQTTGSLFVAMLPLTCLSVVIYGGTLDSVTAKSVLGVVYLAIVGTALGSCAFFYVVQACQMSTVGLITLVTPISSMILGYVVAGEVITQAMVVGALMIVVSLFFYQSLHRVLWCKLKR